MSGFYNRRFARTGGYNVQGYSANADYRRYNDGGNAGRPAVTCDFTNRKWVAFAEVQPTRAAWVVAKAGSPNFDFPEKMFAAVVRFGDLTENQGNAIDRLIARDAERASQRPASAPQAASAAFPRIVAAFAAVAAGGGRKPVTIGDVTLSMAGANSTNPGCVYVKVGGTYAGKITPQGIFRAGRDAPADLVGKLVVIEADVQGAVRAHAERIAAQIAAALAAGQPIDVPCGCCGILLTDPVSRARGIGPICAGRWGF
jgi:hypothetical protein